MGVAFEVLGGLVAHEFESIAAFDQRLPFGREPLQLDGFHFGAILLALRAPLRQLVRIEVALDLVGRTMEEIDRRPEQVFEVGLKNRRFSKLAWAGCSTSS